MPKSDSDFLYNKIPWTQDDKVSKSPGRLGFNPIAGPRRDRDNRHYI